MTQPSSIDQPAHRADRGPVDRWLARPWLALVVAMIVHTALFVAVQRDLASADPLYYAAYAHDLAFRPSHLFTAHDNFPFVMRLGVTAPIALLDRLFGASPLVTNLPGLFAGLGIMAIAYAAASTPRAKWLAVLFAMVCTPLLVDARELSADLPSGAVMAASILCLSRRDRPRGQWWLVAAVAVWFAAFQVKEVAVWCVPVWAYAVIRDLRDRGGRWVVRTYAPAIGVGASLLAGYLVFCAVLWGDPLARANGIRQAASVHDWSLVGRPTSEWVARLTWKPPALLWAMFRAALVSLVLSPWLVRGRDRIWVVATAAIILLYWFGSATTDVYMPLPSGRRVVLSVVPFIIVVSALATDAALDRIRRPVWRIGLGLAFVVLLVVPHVRSVRKALLEDRPERDAYVTLRAEVAKIPDRVVLVCGDHRGPMFTDYYLGFDLPANLVVVTAPDFAAAPLPAPARILFLVNTERSGGVGKDLARRAEALELRRLAWHSRVRLYDAGDGTRFREALAGQP